MNEYYKALYAFFQTMGDTATDVFWGDNPGLDREADMIGFTDSDYSNAFDAACAELAFDEATAEWYMRLPAVLADYYGRHLRAAFIQKQVGAALPPKGGQV